MSHKKKARARLDKELKLIDELGLAGFFLLHWEVLELARELRSRVVGATRRAGRCRPAGRGELGRLDRLLPDRLSHVDPVASGLSLGRFLNREIASVPDIDLDFPRDIREKLMPAVTDRYGREHAALVAAFRPTARVARSARSARRSGCRRPSSSAWPGSSDGWTPAPVAEELASLPDADAKLRLTALAGVRESCAARSPGPAPTHSQHPGGMVISPRPLVELVPVMPAAMAGRQLCQWDKDSCSDAGFLKIDLLGLGCSRRSRSAST